MWVRSLKIIESGAIQKLGCGFLFAFYSDYGAILYRLRDIATYRQKIAKFLYPTCVYRPAEGWPRRNFVKLFDADKTRMIGLPYGPYGSPYGEKTMTVCLSVFI